MTDATYFSLTLQPPPTSTLFPYTTLFRSIDAPIARPDLRADRARTADAEGLRRTGRRLADRRRRSEEHTSELQSLRHLVCRLLLEKKKTLSPRPRTVIT